MKPLAQDPRSRPARGTGDILVTGATGLLGREVCRLLADRKTRFRALVRTSSTRSHLDGTGAWMVEGDLTRPGSLVGALDGVRTVLHLAGVVRNPDPSANRAVHVDGTRNLLEAATAAGVERVVAISSDTVRRERRDAYAQSKADAEALVLAWAGEGVILRPPMMLGPGSPHLAQLSWLSRLPVVPVPRGSGRRAPVWAADVATAVLAAADLPTDRLPTTPVDLVGESELPIGELIAAVARADGRRAPKIVPVPARLAAVGARLLGKGAGQRVAGLAEQVPADGTQARELLGWDPRPI